MANINFNTSLLNSLQRLFPVYAGANIECAKDFSGFSIYDVTEPVI